MMNSGHFRKADRSEKMLVQGTQYMAKKITLRFMCHYKVSFHFYFLHLHANVPKQILSPSVGFIGFALNSVWCMQLGNAVVSLFVVVTQTLFAQWYQESIDKQDVVDRTTLCVIEQFVRQNRQKSQ